MKIPQAGIPTLALFTILLAGCTTLKTLHENNLRKAYAKQVEKELQPLLKETGFEFSPLKIPKETQETLDTWAEKNNFWRYLHYREELQIKADTYNQLLAKKFPAKIPQQAHILTDLKTLYEVSQLIQQRGSSGRAVALLYTDAQSRYLLSKITSNTFPKPRNLNTPEQNRKKFLATIEQVTKQKPNGIPKHEITKSLEAAKKALNSLSKSLTPQQLQFVVQTTQENMP